MSVFTTSNKTAPDLRFFDFSDEWNTQRLKDVVKINQGLQIPISDRLVEPEDGAYFYITNEFLRPGNKKHYYIKNPPDSVVCTEDDILMTRTGNTGKVVTDVSGAFHNNFFKIKYPVDEVDKKFLVSFLKLPSTQHLMLRLAGTSTIPDLNHTDFYKIPFTKPTLDEQQKIADFLGSVDAWLDNLRQQKTALQTYKQGMMQKLFTRQVRFKDENGKDFPKWEEKKLSEMGRIVTGATPSTSHDEFYGGSIPWVTPTDIGQSKNIEKTRKMLTEEGLAVGRFVAKNSLLVTCIASIGKNAVLRVDGSCNQQINSITPNSEHSVDFLYYLLDTNKNELLKYAGAGAMQMLNKNDFSAVRLHVATLEEQKKIADFLMAVDKTIASKAEEIAKVEQWKKGLMQKMFV